MLRTGQTKAQKAELFIHVGTHKTGSTAIQQALRKQQKLPAAEGIAVLPISREIKQLVRCERLQGRVVGSVREHLNHHLAKPPVQNGKAIR